MIWTEQHQYVMEAFVGKFGLPGNVPGSDDEARDWIWKLAEQFAHSFPTEPWGTKRASSTRPQSTDVLAVNLPSGMEGWDVLFHQGAPDQSLNNLVGHHSERMADQVFLRVKPVNHLVTQPPVPNPPEPTPNPVFNLPWDRGEMLDELWYLHEVYKEDLKRPDGLWIDGHPDFEGIATWILEVYQKARIEGKSRQEARGSYLEQIRNSEEYRRKH